MEPKNWLILTVAVIGWHADGGAGRVGRPAAGRAGELTLVAVARLGTAEPADAFMVDTSGPSHCTTLGAASTTTGEHHRKKLRRADGSAGSE